MRRRAPLSALGLAAAALAAAATLVELSPRVEGDFFFADDDPQMQASRQVQERFPSGGQVILRVEDRVGDPAAYARRIEVLTADLLVVPGVENGYSIATSNPARSPLYARILLTPDERATNVVLLVDGADPETLLPAIEDVVGRHRGEELGVVVSGVPAIVEQIRRALYRDLVVFSAAAVVVFALLLGLVYRDPAIVAGTVATCLASVSVTLLVVQAMDVGIGLLTANLVTIVFVLTLSHVVFLTSNWRREMVSRGADRAAALGAALHSTWEGSFWSMTTTLLGFASLLVASARPLRELGVAGAVGALVALGVAYAVYPCFLGWWARPPSDSVATGVARPLTGAAWVLPLAAVVVVAAGIGVPRLDTDPGLLSYFSEGSDLYEGLARIDRDGGSSTLDIVVRDPGGAPISEPDVFSRLQVLQGELESDSAVGVVLSPTVLIEHARTIPLAGLLPVSMLLEISTSDALDGVGLGFVRPDRSEARYSLRMRETLEEDRHHVLSRLRDRVEASGLEPVAVAGLYDLQAQLGSLIAYSLRIGIGGLLLLFLGVAVVVGRGLRAAATMWVCLAGIPVVILGLFGHLGVAMDIITSPAANIALAVGADSMIHLVVRMRRLATAGAPAPWGSAVAQVGPAILGATGIVCAGFGIFALSSFPPTQRFGFAVIVGSAAAAAMALVVLPRLACLGSSGDGRLSSAAG
jgi:predicted RND superfamily exporter protein